MKIVYCREHAPNIVIAVDGEAGTHDDGGVDHTDTGVVTVANDYQTEGESIQAWFDRIGTTFQSDFV